MGQTPDDFDPHALAERLVALTDTLRNINSGQFDRAYDLAEGMLMKRPHGQRLAMSALDGLRWGHRAASVVERGGGAMVRVRTQGMSSATFEYSSHRSDLDLSRVTRAIEDALRPDTTHIEDMP